MDDLCISTQQVRRIELMRCAYYREHVNVVKSLKQSLVLYGQATKRTRWMPRQLEAMKDVGACDKLGGAGKQAVIPRSLNGGTHLLLVSILQ